MNTERGNYTENTSILDLLKAVKANIFKTMCTSEVCVIREDFGDDTYRCEYLTDSNTFVVALKFADLELSVGDVVLLVFTDRDYRASLNAYKSGQADTSVESTAYHQKQFGVIVGVIFRRTTT